MPSNSRHEADIWVDIITWRAISGGLYPMESNAGLRFRGGYRIPGRLRHYSGNLRDMREVVGPVRLLKPGSLTELASCNMASASCQTNCPQLIHMFLNPRFLNLMASCDVAKVLSGPTRWSPSMPSTASSMTETAIRSVVSVHKCSNIPKALMM